MIDRQIVPARQNEMEFFGLQKDALLLHIKRVRTADGEPIFEENIFVPFDEYRKLMMSCDAIVDQLYSYTPSMNPLEAMSHGLICIGGGEPENYEVLNETELRPIVNVEPTFKSVYSQIENMVLHPENISTMQHQSIEYIRKHHDYIKVAKQYEKLYMK